MIPVSPACSVAETTLATGTLSCPCAGTLTRRDDGSASPPGITVTSACAALSPRLPIQMVSLPGCPGAPTPSAQYQAVETASGAGTVGPPSTGSVAPGAAPPPPRSNATATAITPATAASTAARRGGCRARPPRARPPGGRAAGARPGHDREGDDPQRGLERDQDVPPALTVVPDRDRRSRRDVEAVRPAERLDVAELTTPGRGAPVLVVGFA